MTTSSAPRRLTDFKFVNLFTTDVSSGKGTHPWTFASRKPAPGARADAPDAVVIVAVVEEGGEARLVLTREFRAPLAGYEISVPSGLVDAGESAADAAKRELREETGLEMTRVAHVSPALASSAGLTDETVSLVYVEARGSFSQEHLDAHEEITAWLASLTDVQRLLRNPGQDIVSSRLYPVLVGFAQAGRIALPTF